MKSDLAQQIPLNGGALPFSPQSDSPENYGVEPISIENFPLITSSIDNLPSSVPAHLLQPIPVSSSASYLYPPTSSVAGSPYSHDTRYTLVSADSTTTEPVQHQNAPASTFSTPASTLSNLASTFSAAQHQTTAASTFSPGYTPLPRQHQATLNKTPTIDYHYPNLTLENPVCSSADSVQPPVQLHIDPNFPYHLFEYPVQNTCGGKIKKEKKRTEFSSKDLKVLEAAFAESDFARGAKREQLASSLGVSLRSITVWFQNKRAKLRKEKKRLEMLERAAKTGIVGEVNLKQ